MTTLNFIIWNANPEIFTIPIPFIDKELTLRWYGLLFALGFLITQQIMYYIYKKEGKPEKDVDTITIYMVIATIVGARLGHVLFYGHEQFGPQYYLENPLEILYVWEGGLASHGGAIGILFALWLYSRKKLPGQNYLQILDRIVIMCALVGCLIRFGNVMNSEIIGKPTKTDYGVVFARNVTDQLMQNDNIKNVQYVKSDSGQTLADFQPIKILIEFKPSPGSTADDFSRDIENNVARTLSAHYRVTPHIYQQGPLNYTVTQDVGGNYFAIINTYGIPRHPAQLYESISCLLLFFLLFWLWSKKKENLPEGSLFGIFLIVCFGLRIVWESMKINQVQFEENMAMNMGQWLSIPLVLAGFYFVYRAYRKKA